ncbi:hypothetical protein CPT_Paso_030 [Rhizobium phage Paso]|uniref:Uncharacterized protein n=1 Tax=Rhizobium phage Paso TaxID=2767574 RepID=A0A7L8G4Q0_9CAUD|nr:hypothetical protein CPT_Paso_030 [Rhizobium phage Paso]
MKLDSPTIYVLHKVEGKWANSAFQFTGLVDRRRVKREIIRSFRRGGEIVHPSYIDASIDASLRKPQGLAGKQMLGRKLLTAITDADETAVDYQAWNASTSLDSMKLSEVHDPAPASIDTLDNRERARKEYWERHPPTQLSGEELARAEAGFAQQAKDNYEVSKEIQERDAAKAKNKNNGGRPR